MSRRKPGAAKAALIANAEHLLCILKAENIYVQKDRTPELCQAIDEGRRNIVLNNCRSILAGYGQLALLISEYDFHEAVEIAREQLTPETTQEQRSYIVAEVVDDLLGDTDVFPDLMDCVETALKQNDGGVK